MGEDNAVEGIVLGAEDLAPFASPEEAQDQLNTAMTLFRAGVEGIAEATRLLAQARARRAWEITGHASWEACLDHLLSSLQLRVPGEIRLQVATTLARTGASQRGIAQALVVNQSTISRDLERAARLGLLDDLPETITATNGQVHPRRPPRHPEPAPLDEPVRDEPARDEPAQGEVGSGERRRKALLARFRDILWALRELTEIHQDDRYPKTLGDFALFEGELRQAGTVIAAMLDDFEARPFGDSR